MRAGMINEDGPPLLTHFSHNGVGSVDGGNLPPFTRQTEIFRPGANFFKAAPGSGYVSGLLSVVIAQHHTTGAEAKPPLSVGLRRQ